MKTKLFGITAVTALALLCTSRASAQSYVATAHGGFCYVNSVEQCSFPITGGGSFSFDSTGAARLYISFGHVETAPSGSLSYTIKSAEFGACPDYPGNGTCEFVVVDVSGGWTNTNGSTATVSGEYTVESVHAGRNSSNRPYSGELTITVNVAQQGKLVYPCGSDGHDCFKHAKYWTAEAMMTIERGY